MPPSETSPTPGIEVANAHICRETSQRKAPTHYCNDLVDLLIELAMERKNGSHMDKYLRKHLRRETPAEKCPAGRSPQHHSNPGKGRGGQLKYMTETPSSKGKGTPKSFLLSSYGR